MPSARLRSAMEREYFVVYDYGTGGVWAIMTGPSKSVLQAAYPELVVFDTRPDWVDDAEYARIKDWTGFRFDQPNDYWARWFRQV